MDRSVIRELEAIVGAEHVRTDPGDVEPYSRDATPAFRAVPDAVVWPRTAEEVAAILKLATARRRAGGAARRRLEPVRRHRRRARRDRPGADPDGQDPGGQRGRAARPRRDRRHHRGAVRRGGRQGPALRAGPGQPHRLDRRGQRRHLRGRAARAQVRRHPQLRAGRHGRAAHRRDHQDRWPAVEGRGGLRPHPAAHRLGGHPRGAHGGDGRAAAHAGHHQHRRRVLPDAGRRRAAPSARSSAHGIVPATLEFLDAKCIGAVEQYAHLGLRDDAGALLLFGDDGARGRRRPQPGPHRGAVHRRPARWR